MPTIAIIGAYRFFFYSADGREPAHIHVEKGDAVAKFWLLPVRLAKSGGMKRTELTELDRMVEDNAPAFLEAWNDFFDA
jgi:Domain of unknown function (DUF4160)